MRISPKLSPEWKLYRKIVFPSQILSSQLILHFLSTIFILGSKFSFSIKFQENHFSPTHNSPIGRGCSSRKMYITYIIIYIFSSPGRLLWSTLMSRGLIPGFRPFFFLFHCPLFHSMIVIKVFIFSAFLVLWVSFLQYRKQPLIVG